VSSAGQQRGGAAAFKLWPCLGHVLADQMQPLSPVTGTVIGGGGSGATYGHRYTPPRTISYRTQYGMYTSMADSDAPDLAPQGRVKY
jgi:hypothetical protein